MRRRRGADGAEANNGNTVITGMRSLQRLRAATYRISGWRRYVLAFGLGILAVAALPPFHMWVLLLPAFTGLFWLVESSPSRRACFFTGWWFGFGHFIAGLYWIANALLTKPEQFGWLAPIAVSGLAAMFALYPGIAALLTRLSGARGAGGALVFAAAWTALEWVRSWALSGFPWNLIGSVWTFSDTMIQITAVIGTYGLSLLTVAAATMPAALCADGRDRKAPMVAMLCLIAMLAATWIGGKVRLTMAGTPREVPGVRLRLVQPNIDQRLKWKLPLLDEHLRTQAEMGALPAAAPPTHIIWSETAAPLFLAEERARMRMIGRLTPRGGLTITGTLRRSPPGTPYRVWNSLLAMDHDGVPVATFDKSHLVPFGEYVPFRDLLDVAKVTAGTVDFSPGGGVQTLRLPGLPPVSPLICYEVIFPGKVVDPEDRPEWMLNITNDAWYGQSTGPYQHLASARLRAVEEGLPLVRVANTGISAIIDPWGRVVARKGLGERGIVDGPLPAPLATQTVYARLGNWAALLVVVATVSTGLLLSRRG